MAVSRFESRRQTATAASTTPDVQGGFMFVPLNGQRGQKQDRNARKSIRAHVMHNYRDQQQSNQTAAQVKVLTTRKPGEMPGGGQKFRFRLEPTGLVKTVPYRLRRKGVREEAGAPVPPNRVVQNQGEGLNRDVAACRGITGARREVQETPANFDPFAELLDPALFVTPSNAFAEDVPAWNPQPGYMETIETEDEAGRDLYSWLSEKSSPTRQAGLRPLESHDAESNYPWELNQEFLSTSPLQLFGRSRTDPFSVLPFQLSATDEVLLDRFQNFTQRSWCPVNAKGPWFMFAMRDELMFHATMYHWSLKFNDRENTFLIHNPRFMEHKVAAIRMINERLFNPIEATKDESLAAVTALVNAEIGFGTREEAANHMNGLRALVEIRGGIESMGGEMDGVLQAFIGWNDLMFSELVGDKLQFTKARFPNLQDARQQLCKGPCFRRNLEILGVAEPRVWEPLQGEIIELFHHIRQLCEDVQKRPFPTLSEKEARERSDRLHCVERDLRTLSQIPVEVPEPDVSSRDLVWRACAAAGLIYVHHMLRGLSVAYRMFDTLCQSLRESLLLTGDMVEKWRFAPELLMWAMTTGVVISTGRPEHDWFLGKLAELCKSFRYDSWDRYRRPLASFLWVGDVDEERYGRIWEQIEPLMR